MQIKVLGKSPAWPDAGGACSGYLITEADFTLLLDCGSGVLGKLRVDSDYAQVDTVVLSHLHPDHFIDLIPYSFALLYSPLAPHSRPEVYGPPGTLSKLQAIATGMGLDDQLQRAFVLREYDPEASLRLGPLTARFQEVPHFIQTFACELSCPTGRFTYGADCRFNEELISFAHETDLLLVEATIGGVPASPDPDPGAGHMTAREAGELARRAAARRALISHYSDELDLVRLRQEAEAGFGNSVELAHEGWSFTL